LAALAAFRQQPEAQQNDDQIDYLENLVQHINVPTEFNENMTEYACERHNCL
jgi:hypothetical protein